MIKFLLLSLLIFGTAWAEPLDRIVAVVNNEVILESELDDMERNVRQRSDGSFSDDAILRNQVLERLIMQQIQVQKAASIGIRVGDDSLNAALRQIASNNNLSLREFRDVLEKDGFDFIDFRESIREDMIISRLRKKEVGDKVIVSEREIDNFLATQAVQGNDNTTYHLLHILISVPEAALPEQVQMAQIKLKKVQGLLNSGTDFVEVATSYSDGQNALEGGDLGWRTQSELPSLFADKVLALEVGQYSDAIRSGSGFHIIKLAGEKNTETHLVKQTLASHILIRTDELTSDEEAEQRLNQLRDRILSGEDFAELARAHSDDTGSAIADGSLGWSSPGAMVPEFEQQMEPLEIGEVGVVFKSRFGWHLIKVYERREENMAEEFNRNKAREQIRQRKIEEDTESWLRQLRDESFVEYRDI